MTVKRNIFKDILFGLAIGDALGVPFEFRSRKSIALNPITDMIGFGTHSQPPGTWSDDSSLTFCLAEALTNGFDLNRIAKNFIRWYKEAYWTAHEEVFDVGNSTLESIQNLWNGFSPEVSGGFEEVDNGNGSLMRILPLVGFIRDMPIEDRFILTKKVSAITHAHIRSVIACFYYLEFARMILLGKDKFDAYRQLQSLVPEYLFKLNINPAEITLFDRLLSRDISKCMEEEIESSGYVLHTLEASVWCILTTDNYKDAVLKAVNLGGDTDTTAAVAGGMAGLIYGCETIPEKWLIVLAKRKEIQDLADRALLARP